MQVLLMVNGLGMGNSTRCHAIVQHLNHLGCSVHIITSGNGVWYFKNKGGVSSIHEIDSLFYASDDKGLSIGGTLGCLGALYRIQRSNSAKVNQILDDISPKVVITDSMYVYRPFKKRNIPIVALNNSDMVVHSLSRFKDRPKSVLPQFYGIEMWDYFFHRFIPNLVISPVLDPSLKESGGNIRRVGPIVREGYNPTHVSVEAPVKRIAILLSGSKFGTPINLKQDSYSIKIDVIGREKPVGTPEKENVTYHGKILDTKPILEKADLAVINGGFSAVSEMYIMKKPMVVIPVDRHAEQWVNARTIEYLGVGLMATSDNYESVMWSAVNRVEEFRERYLIRETVENGAQVAAKAAIHVGQNKDQLKDTQYDVMAKFWKYSGVAVCSAAADWVVFAALQMLGLNYLWCQMFARLTGGGYSFAANKYWSFKSGQSGKVITQGRRFLLLYVFSYGLSLALLFTLVDLLHINAYLGKLLGDSACLLVNFLFMNNYVFKKGAGLTSHAQKLVRSIVERT